MRRKIIYAAWSLLLGGTLVFMIFFAAISWGFIGYIPPVEELENPINKFASQIISSDNKLLGTWSYSKQNRIFVNYDKIPQNIVDALIATEDIRFRNHSGVDAKAVLRAVVKRVILHQASAGGGSTITQQLAKQLYTEKPATSFFERVCQKPIEWVIAVKLERYYTKDEIITLYLNYFDFLNNAVGVKTAANTYFGKEPQSLNLEECATLVGMCKNPSYFNPVRNNERCKERRNVVLDQMIKAGYLSKEDGAIAKAKPLTLNFHRVDHKEGEATYLREYLRNIMMAKKPHFADYRNWQKQKYYEDSIAWEQDPLYGWCNKHQKKNGDYYNIYTDGLKIYTTIDSHMQRYAEEAVYEHVAKYLQPHFFAEKRGSSTAPFTNALTPKEVKDILDRNMKLSDRYRSMKESGQSEAEIRKVFNTKREMTVFSYHGDIDTIMTPMDSIRYYKHFLRAGFLSMDPHTGYVKAYVGGLDYPHFQYDMAMVGRRQVGSTIKPFLYSLAMENNFSPCDLAPNSQHTYMVNGIPWTPRNSGHARIGQMVTLKWGLAQSNNWISAYLMSKLNPHAFVRLLHSYGIRNNQIVASPSLCLGPCEITVGEMVSAYTAFANKGIRVAPLFVTRIEDNEGNVIAKFQPQMNEVIGEESAYKMLVMMRAVINEGTGSRLRFRFKFNADIAGKTGTTNKNSDAWFMGITPRLVSGCWAGGEDRDIHFDSMTYGQGASMALPIWAIYMKKVYADKRLGYSQDERFSIPDDFDPCKDSFGDLNSWGTEDYENGIDDVFE